MRRSLASAALLFSLSAPAAARLGVDVSTPVSAADAACMRANHSIEFAVSRAWYSDGAGVDRGALTSAAAFKAAGVAFDVYMFPCSFGLPAAEQVTQLLANLTAARVDFGTLWMDIESNPDPRCAWSAKNFSRNCGFLDELLGAAVRGVAPGQAVGVYSSIHEWTEIMTAPADPAGCTVGAARGLPLWYPHYETPPNPSFSDFKPFGGWAAPTVKQFGDGDVPPGRLCGIGVDNNWMP